MFVFIFRLSLWEDLSFFCGLNSLLDPVAFAFELFELFEVLAKDGMGLDAVLETAQLQIQLRRRLFGQAIEHPVPVALCQNQPVGPQVGEMLGDGDLGQFQNILKMTDAQGPPGEEMQNTKACFITQAAINLHEFHIRRQEYTSDGI